MIASFSFKQSPHFLEILVYAGTCWITDHFTSGVMSVRSFMLQTCFAMLVLLMYRRLLNDVLCTEPLCLNGPSVAPK